MNRIIRTVYLLTLMTGAGVFSAQTQAQQDLRPQHKRGVTSVVRPIIPGFNPDPSICRAGGDYYIVTSSNEYFPGLPIYHSRDLVEWRMIGHVLSNPKHLDLDSVAGSKGLYAPTIRYHEGVFYVTCTLTGGLPGKPGGNFITTARDPRGPWSTPVWLDAPGIDPSLFFDEEGKVYYQGNYTPEDKRWARHRKIFLQEIDLKESKLVGHRVDILDAADYYMKGTIDGGSEAGADYLEAPHVYKKDGYYYLTTSHGGTFQQHALSFWRSRQIFGPYESNPANPILSHRNLSPNYPVTSTGHGDLVMDAKSHWHMTFLARRPLDSNIHILGRETFLTPVEWKDGWPQLPDMLSMHQGDLIAEVSQIPADDTSLRKAVFSKGRLSPEWTFIRTPREKWWKIKEGNDAIRIRLRPDILSDIGQPSWLGLRQDRLHTMFTTQMEFRPEREGEEAGLTVFRDKDHYFKFTLIREKEGDSLQLSKRVIGQTTDHVISRVPFNQKKVILRITGSGRRYSFEYGVSADQLKYLEKDADGGFLGSPAAGRFTGTMIGIYATGNGVKSMNSAAFKNISY
jgi:xylan 1,4-beta-xylosidase